MSVRRLKVLGVFDAQNLDPGSREISDATLHRANDDTKDDDFYTTEYFTFCVLTWYFPPGPPALRPAANP
jgi:hypothetical protein